MWLSAPAASSPHASTLTRHRHCEPHGQALCKEWGQSNLKKTSEYKWFIHNGKKQSYRVVSLVNFGL